MFYSKVDTFYDLIFFLSDFFPVFTLLLRCLQETAMASAKTSKNVKKRINTQKHTSDDSQHARSAFFVPMRRLKSLSLSTSTPFEV